MTEITLKKRTPEEREEWMNQQIVEHVLFKQRVREQLDYWIGSLDDDWVVRNIKKELGLE